MKLSEFSNKAKITLIVVIFVGGAGFIALNSNKSIDVLIPTQTPVVTQTPQATSTPVFSESPEVSPAPTKTPISAEENGCIITGCSGQICSDKEVITTCEFKEEYACYKSTNAKCERQNPPAGEGECGWTPTEELVACLMSAFQNESVPQ